jgi:hypothetical protein
MDDLVKRLRAKKIATGFRSHPSEDGKHMVLSPIRKPDPDCEEAAARIEQLEAERDHAWNMVAKADADAVRCAAQSLEDKIRANSAEAERDRAWNEAIEAAATDLQAFQERAGGYQGAPFWLAWAIERIRSLAKEAGE